MGNILTADDSNFVGGVGHWVNNGLDTTLTTSSTPTPPDGGDVLELTFNHTIEFGGSVSAKLPYTFYVTAGEQYTLDMEVATAAANVGTNIFAQASILIDTGSDTYATGLTTVLDVNPGSGWHHLHIDAASIGTLEPGWYIGIQVDFATDYADDPPGGPGVDGFFLDDAALIANVVLSQLGVGGWGVGQIRMNQ